MNSNFYVDPITGERRYNVLQRYAEGGAVDTRLLEDVARLGADDPRMELAGYFKNANQATRNEAMKRGFYNANTGPDYSLIDQARAMKAANPAADTSALFANANFATKNEGSKDRFYQFSNQEINDSNARALASTEFVDQDGRTVTPPLGDEQDWLSKSSTVGVGGPGNKIIRAVYLNGVKPDPTNPTRGIPVVYYNPFAAQNAAKYIQDAQERQRQGRVDGGMYRYTGLDVSDLTTPYDPKRERDPGIPFLGRYTVKDPQNLEPFKPLSLPTLGFNAPATFSNGGSVMGANEFDNNSIQPLALLAQSQGRNLASPEEAGMFATGLQQANINPNSMSRYTTGGKQLQFTNRYDTTGQPLFSETGSVPAGVPHVSVRNPTLSTASPAAVPSAPASTAAGMLNALPGGQAPAAQGQAVSSAPASTAASTAAGMLNALPTTPPPLVMQYEHPYVNPITGERKTVTGGIPDQGAPAGFIDALNPNVYGGQQSDLAVGRGFFAKGNTVNLSPLLNNRDPGQGPVRVDQNIGDVRLAGKSTDYKYSQAGNQLRVFDKNNNLVSSIAVQGDQDGTKLTFDDGSTFAKGVKNAAGSYEGGLQVGGVAAGAFKGLPPPSPPPGNDGLPRPIPPEVGVPNDPLPDPFPLPPSIPPYEEGKPDPRIVLGNIASRNVVDARIPRADTVFANSPVERVFDPVSQTFRYPSSPTKVTPASGEYLSHFIPGNVTLRRPQLLNVTRGDVPSYDQKTGTYTAPALSASQYNAKMREQSLNTMNRVLSGKTYTTAEYYALLASMRNGAFGDPTDPNFEKNMREAVDRYVAARAAAAPKTETITGGTGNDTITGGTGNDTSQDQVGQTGGD